jgi:type III pantothenate kinase
MSVRTLLLIDAGNTRVKWATLRQDSAGSPSSIDFDDRGVIELVALRRSETPFRRLLAGLAADTRVIVCNVAGAAFEGQLRAVARRAGVSAPQFVRSARSTAGVRNGYPQAWRLGADRWAALIGARALRPRQALCIVGIGSALTVDLLDSDGLHRGGCIAPSPQMMIESLLRDTAGIRRRARLGGTAAVAKALSAAWRDSGTSGHTLFTHDTHDALIAGARHACAALIERAARQARAQLGRRVQVLLAGGGADAVMALLQLRCRREDDLVLRGLAVVALAGRTIA